MSDLPQPKYKIGDVVYSANVYSTAEEFTCPDCHGTARWVARSPAGDEMECACPRCQGGVATHLPRLSHRAWRTSTPRLTIGAVRIETDAEPECQVSYMAHETGIGSGSIHYEPLLYGTEAEAQAAADVEKAAAEQEYAQQPETQQRATLAHMTFKDALVGQCWRAVWDAWWAYRQLREDLESHLEGGEPDEDMQRILEWDGNHRSPAPFAALIQAIDSDGATVASIREQLDKTIGRVATEENKPCTP